MNLKQQLNKKPNLQKHLFERGYLITDDDYSGALHDYPFYGNWKEYVFGDYRFYVYQTVSAFFQQIGNRTFFLIGHAYDPYNMEPDENKLLQYIGGDAVWLLRHRTRETVYFVTYAPDWRFMQS